MSAPQQNINQQGHIAPQQGHIAPQQHNATVNREYVQGTVMQDVKAAVVNETVKQTHLEEVQPVIHREREQTEVRQVVQPMIEKQVAPTQTRSFETREVKDVVREAPSAGFQNRDVNHPHSTRTVEDSGLNQKVLAPIVQETIVKNVIEEVQPVIHREVVQNEVIKHTHHVYEKVQEAPILVQQTREPVMVAAQPIVQQPIIHQPIIQQREVIPVVAAPAPAQNITIEVQQPHHHHHHHHKHQEPSHIIHPVSTTHSETTHASSVPVAYKKEDKLEHKDLINTGLNPAHKPNTITTTDANRAPQSTFDTHVYTPKAH